MTTFQIIVLTIAVIFLILILTFFGLMLRKSSGSTSSVFPPQYNTCPDYWTIGDSSNCIIPSAVSLNTGNLYSNGTLTNATMNTAGYVYDSSNNTSSINFSASGWQGVCSWQTWANQNNIVWDGVSNYNSC